MRLTDCAVDKSEVSYGHLHLWYYGDVRVMGRSQVTSLVQRHIRLLANDSPLRAVRLGSYVTIRNRRTIESATRTIATLTMSAAMRRSRRYSAYVRKNWFTAAGER